MHLQSKEDLGTVFLNLGWHVTVCQDKSFRRCHAKLLQLTHSTVFRLLRRGNLENLLCYSLIGISLLLLIIY